MFGRSPHGERGLKYELIVIGIVFLCRSPHGERGLKYITRAVPGDVVQSLSSWRAWIEIISKWAAYAPWGRSPHGERGLKWRNEWCRRSPPPRVALLMESVD